MGFFPVAEEEVVELDGAPADKGVSGRWWVRAEEDVWPSERKVYHDVKGIKSECVGASDSHKQRKTEGGWRKREVKN